MKNCFLTVTVISLLFLSCDNGTKNKLSDYDGSSPESALKSFYRYYLTQDEYAVFQASDVYQREHADEVIKTLEVVEKIEIPKKSITLLLYRYSIGADIVRESRYFKKVGNKWYIHSEYFSDYDDDPFKNGDGTRGKEILKKKEKWTSENNAWWN